MLLLAADTSGKDGSIALAMADDSPGADGARVIEVVPLAGGTFSAQLVPQIAALLAKHGYTKNDIGALIAASGPGSFTGLRVGLAAVKALGEILDKPIVAVSLLEVMAVLHSASAAVATALDAGRGEIYVGEYEVGEGSARCRREALVKQNEVPAQINSRILITPYAPLAEAARAAGLGVTEIAPLHAGDVARVGWRRLRAGETVSPEQLEANYIRRSDAEELRLAHSS